MTTDTSLPEGWTTANDVARILCGALRRIDHIPEAIEVELEDGAAFYLGVRLGGAPPQLFLQLLGGSLMTSMVIDGKTVDNPLKITLQQLDMIGLSLACNLPTQDGEFCTFLPEDVICWPGIPLTKSN